MTATVYACAVQTDNEFVGKFCLPGKKPEYITGADGRPVSFPSAELAELNAWRFIGARLNGARSPQIFIPRAPKRREIHMTEAEKLFAPKPQDK